MRKETTLGLTIGGIAVVAAVIGFGTISHKNKAHAPIPLIADGNGGAGDVGGQNTDDTNPPASSKIERVEPAKAPETKKGAAPAKPTNTQVVIADPKKEDAIHNLLFGRGEVPLMGSSVTPEVGGDPAPPVGSGGGSGDVQPPISHEAPPGAAPPTTQPGHTGGAKSHTHVVQKGETFSTIAATAYGSANYYPHLMRANPTINAKSLKPGTTITLPDISEVKPAEKAAGTDAKDVPHGDVVQASHKTVAAVDATKQYKVAPGDSLHRIAIKLYGKIDMVDKIYEANKTAIGPNPAALKVGMVLALPQPPVISATASLPR